MNARCGLEDCDCEYTIGGLLRRLEIIAIEALATVRETRAELCNTVQCSRPIHPCPDCVEIGLQEGQEAERQPPGA